MIASTDAGQELRRLRWQCRRGLLELDLLLGRFLERSYAGAPAAEQEAFRQLLRAPDPRLQAWLFGQETAPPEFRIIIAKLSQ